MSEDPWPPFSISRYIASLVHSGSGIVISSAPVVVLAEPLSGVARRTVAAAIQPDNQSSPVLLGGSAVLVFPMAQFDILSTCFSQELRKFSHSVCDS